MAQKENDPAQMVILGQYNTDFEANLVKTMLEDAGIECALTGEYAKYSFLNDPVKLLVHSADLERARQIVESAATADVSESELSDVAMEHIDDNTCTNQYGRIAMLIVAVIVAIITVYYIFSWSIHL